MKKTLLTLCFLLAALGGRSADITVLQWNIWQEGTQVKGGYDAIVDELVRLKPDFVTFRAVRNSHGVDFIAKLRASLAERGLTYYGFRTDDTGLLSRHPITDSVTVFPLHNDHGSIYRLRTEVNGRKIAVYTSHLDYLDDAYYNVRGYDGSTWREIPVPTTVAEVLERNDRSRRDEAIAMFLTFAADDQREGYISILGGDFNEPSYIDWCDATRDLYDHNGLAVPWPQTLRLAQEGFIDCWRALYPNPVTHPGFTFPADNPDVPVEKLSWTPKADERDRIDYLFYRGEGIRVTDCRLFGPAGTIGTYKRLPAEWDEPIILPQGTWPTDHKGVWARFELD